MAARNLLSVQNYPQLQRFVIRNVRPTGKKLGVGSYGSVEEVMVNGVVCAGKKIHEALLDQGNEGVQNIARKYVEECELLSEMRHPHIVQFIGLCFLNGFSMPVLLMEKLVMNLDDLLENTPDIPLALKRSILSDICKGLVYLHNHSPPVIHRDLSAKNVLLNSAMTAKISDLGNSRIAHIQPGQLVKTLSRAPGTMVYMAPEALYSPRDCDPTKSRYGTRIDIFSFGHLALFTLTQDFPQHLLPPAQADPINPGRLIGLTEVERRKDYIDQLHQQLGDEHSLVQLVKWCLHNNPTQRPSADGVLQQLEGMRSQIIDPYHHLNKLEMIKLVQRSQSQIQHQAEQSNTIVKLLQARIHGLETQLQCVTNQRSSEVEALTEQVAALTEDNTNLGSLGAAKDAVLHSKERVISSLSRVIQNLRSRQQTRQHEMYYPPPIQGHLITNTEEFECPLCFTSIKEGGGVRLRSCLHQFCKECLRAYIMNCTEAEVKCLFLIGKYECGAPMTESEIRGLVTPEELDALYHRGLRQAEYAAGNSFHCKTPDCPGFCFYKDEVNEFNCPICGKENCLLCKAIHEDMFCQEYQDDQKRLAANLAADQATQDLIEGWIRNGDAMNCPACNILLIKKDGSDWIRCSMCKTEICWATKGPRWGPRGRGDTSGGCKCRVGRKKCHPLCRNCH